MRLSHQDERDARVRDEAAAPAPISRAARMLALQRTVGNHAVAAMLAREAAPKPEPAPGLAIVHGLGSIPLESVGLGEARKSADREHPSTSQDITVLSKMGEHSQALALANQRGGVFEVDLFIGDKVHIKLHKALIASFQESGHGDASGSAMDSWTLNAESIEFVTDER